jgi:hypothetical protein
MPSSPELIEDVRKAPDDILSIDEPLKEVRTTHKGWTDTHRNRFSSSSPIIPLGSWT